MSNKIIISTLLFCLLGLFTQSCDKEEVTPDEKDEVTYSADIKPLLDSNCASSACHGGDTPAANLSLDNYASAKAGGESGKLFARINNESNPMPPSGLMSADKRDKIKEWIDGGYKE